MSRPANRARADHLVLLTVDGLRPDVYLDAAWPAPTIQQLYRDGVHARVVRSVFPSLTYPAHTTIVTGARPARHGICHNHHFRPGGGGPWYTDASAIRVPTLWDAVHAAGRTTAAVMWPVTVGASAIDWNVPDLWSVGPPAEALAAIRQAARPAGLLDELEREATGRLRPETFDTHTLGHDPRVGAIGAYLFERHRPALLLLHLAGIVQVLQEPGWSNPRKRRAVAAADQAVGNLLDAVERVGARERTAVIVMGDHGLMEIHAQLRPNVWLVGAGLRDAEVRGDAWRATFHALGGAAWLRVREPAAENAEAVRRKLRELPPGTRTMFRIVERAELDALGADPAAAFALAAAPGISFDEGLADAAVQPHTGMTHGHLPDDPAMAAGFVGAWAGFRAGTVAPLLPLEGVAPLAAALLGLDFDAPDGALSPGLLTD